MIYEGWSDDFAKAWHVRGFEGSPIGHIQRKLRQDIWVRFHSFPDKRYPDLNSPEDEAQVFDRFAAIGNAAFAEDEEIYYTYFWFSEAEDHLDDIESWSLRPTTWRAIEWRQTLLSTTYDEAQSFGLFAPHTGWFLSPYDGGIDVFSKDTAARDALATQFKSWLSSYPSGL